MAYRKLWYKPLDDFKRRAFYKELVKYDGLKKEPSELQKKDVQALVEKYRLKGITFIRSPHDGRNYLFVLEKTVEYNSPPKPYRYNPPFKMKPKSNVEKKISVKIKGDDVLAQDDNVPLEDRLEQESKDDD